MKFEQISLSALLLSTACVSLAGPVTELENTGQIINNSRATAQLIGASSFTPNASSSVFGILPTARVTGAGGGSDVDFFSFVSGTGAAFFDIDNSSFSFDTLLSLFNSSGTLIAFNDDSPPTDPGSADDRDSFLGVINLAAGVYYLAVSEFTNAPNALFSLTGSADLFRPDGTLGGSVLSGTTMGDSTFAASGAQTGALSYILNISLQAPSPLQVPEPSSIFLLGVGALALLTTRRSRRSTSAQRIFSSCVPSKTD